MRKKILCTLLAVMMLLSCLPVTAFAAYEGEVVPITVSSTKTSVEKNGEFTLTVSFGKKISKLGNLKMVLDYDETKVQVVSVGAGDMGVNAENTTDSGNRYVVYMWDTDGNGTDYPAGTKAFSVVFKAIADGVSNNIAPALTIASGDFGDATFDQNDIPYTIDNATVALTQTLTSPIAVTNLTAPVKHAAPDTAATLPTGMTAGTVKWYEGDAEHSGKFGANKVYRAEIPYTLTTGYTLPVGVSVTTPTDATAATIDTSKNLIKITYGATAALNDLKGTVSITGTPTFGQTLTADISALNYNGESAGTLTYQWKRGGTAISGATGVAYELAEDDIGKAITVEVTNSNNTGSVTSSPTAAVEKADYVLKPNDRVRILSVQKSNGNTVRLSATVPGGEKLDYGVSTDTDVNTTAISWQPYNEFSNEFSNMPAGTYYFFIRVKETAVHKAGSAVRYATPTTINPTPTLRYDDIHKDLKVGDYVEMKPTVSGGDGKNYTYHVSVPEQSLPAGLTLNRTTGVISGTPTNVASSVEVQIIVTSDNLKSSTPVNFHNVAKGDQTAKAVVIASKTDTTITVTAESGHRYMALPAASATPTDVDSRWQDSDSFSGLNRNTAYKVYACIPGNDNYNASPVVSTPVITDKTALTGTVTIYKTAPVFDDTLTATVTDAPHDATYDYQWYRGETAISGAINKTYTATTDDIGKTLKVTLTGNGDFIGSVSSPATTAVAKLTQIITVPDAQSIKFGGTLNIKNQCSSNASGAALVFTNDTLPSGTTFDTATGTVTAGTTAGRFTVTVKSAAVGNYATAEAKTITVTIVAGDPQTITFPENTITKTFGDAKFFKTATNNRGTAGGYMTYASSNTGVATVDPSTGEVTIKGYGETTITATAAAVPGKYISGSGSYTLTVNQKTITDAMVSGVSDSYTYDGSAKTPEPTVTGLTRGADFDYSYASNTNAGTATVTVTGMNNYQGTVNKTFTIGKKPVTAATSATVTKVYDGDNTVDTTIEFTFTGVGNVGQITVTTSGNTYNDKNVGTGKAITIGTKSGTGLDNYNVTYPAVTGEITAKPVDVTISGTPSPVTFGESFSHTASAALLGGDTATYTVLYNGVATKPTAVNTYTLTATISNTNYVANTTFLDITSFTIGKATPSITMAKTEQIRYSNVAAKSLTPNNLDASVPGVFRVTALSDTKGILDTKPTVGGAVSYALRSGLTAEDKDKTADITFKFVPNDATNYDEVTGIVLTIKVINKEPAAVALSMSGWNYGGAAKEPSKTVSFSDTQAKTNPVWTVTYTGTLADGNHTAYAESADKPTLPGSYTVKAVYEDDNHKGENTASFTIAPKALTVTGGVVKNKPFDNTRSATLKTDLIYDGLVYSDVFAPNVRSAEYDSVNVGTGKKVTITLYDLPEKYAWKYTAPNTVTRTAGITPPTSAMLLNGGADRRVITRTLSESYASLSDDIRASYTDAKGIEVALKNKGRELLGGFTGISVFDIEPQRLEVNIWVKSTDTDVKQILLPNPTDLSLRGDNVRILHMKDNGGIEDMTFTIHEENGGFWIEVKHCSPFAIVWYTPVATSGGYTFSKGANVDFKAGKAAEFRIDRASGELLSVSVDGTSLTKGKDYTVKTGDTTTITLAASFVKKLSNGNHSLYANYKYGYANAYFTLSENGVVSADTGDMGVALYAVMALSGAAGAAWVTRRKKKER